MLGLAQGCRTQKKGEGNPAVRSDGVWGRQRGGSGSKAHKELKGGEEGVESEIREAPRHDGAKMEVNFMGGPWLSA